MMDEIRVAAELALRDWQYERSLTLCAILALASMLAPLLVLQGLKNGVVESMRHRLLEDPAILIITPKSDAGNYDRAFIKRLARLPGAAFAIGRTRDTSTDVTLSNAAAGKSASIAMEPAAPGEPLLKSLGIPAPGSGQMPGIVLSARAASALSASAGQILEARLGRRTPAGRLESTGLRLAVTAVMPAAAADRRMAFLPVEVMEDMENYRDYIAVPARDFSGEKARGERRYASFRLYAKDLDSVDGLAAELLSMNIETSTRAREIAGVRLLEKSIGRVILIISAAVGAGFAAFTISSVQSAVSRKLRMLGMLRLLGFSRLSLVIYPLVQVFATTLAGFALSGLIYLAVSAAIRAAFAGQGLYCTLGPAETLVFLAMAVLLAAAAGGRAAFSAAGVEPSQAIREI